MTKSKPGYEVASLTSPNKASPSLLLSDWDTAVRHAMRLSCVSFPAVGIWEVGGDEELLAIVFQAEVFERAKDTVVV